MNRGGYLKIGTMCLAMTLAGCVRLAQSMYLAGCDRDISSATQAIEKSSSDAQRANAYSKRGNAYANKSRYSRTMKLIPPDEYERLFALAIKDHAQAVALDPASKEVYLNRGQSYYERAFLEWQDKNTAQFWADHAAADFEAVILKDPRDYRAFDFLGMVHEQNGEPERAIDDYTKEMALNPLGKARLTDAYCTLGSHYHGQKKYEAAAAGYRKSIDMGGGGDGCGCDPYEPLVALYTVETRQYDEAWEVVHQAQRAKHWLSPELIDRLKKDSGRPN